MVEFIVFLVVVGVVCLISDWGILGPIALSLAIILGVGYCVATLEDESNSESTQVVEESVHVDSSRFEKPEIANFQSAEIDGLHGNYCHVTRGDVNPLGQLTYSCDTGIFLCRVIAMSDGWDIYNCKDEKDQTIVQHCRQESNDRFICND